MKKMGIIKVIFLILGLIIAGLVFFSPLYFMFTSSPWCMLLFLISWLPAKLIAAFTIIIFE